MKCMHHRKGAWHIEKWGHNYFKIKSISFVVHFRLNCGICNEKSKSKNMLPFLSYVQLDESDLSLLQNKASILSELSRYIELELKLLQ